MKSREVEMMVLQEERHRREALERKLQEETQLREELVTQQIKLRDKQKQQVNLGLNTVKILKFRTSENLF